MPSPLSRPHPPFNASHPRVAGEALAQAVRAAMGENLLHDGSEIAKTRRSRRVIL